MAGEAAAHVAEVTTEAAAAAGATAAAAVAGVEAGAAAAIEQAAERVEVAQAVAQAVTDAAVQNAVVQEVHSAIEDLDEWEQAIDARISALELRAETLLSQMGTMQTELAELRASPTVVAVTTQPAEPSSILQPPAVPETTAVVVNPLTAPNANPDPIAASPESPGRRKRWI